MTARYLWLLFALLLRRDPPVGAAGRITVPGQRFRTLVVRPWTLWIAVIPVVLAAAVANVLLEGARWAAYRAIGDLPRWPVAGLTAAFPGVVMAGPVLQPGANGPGQATPNLVQRTGSGPTTSSNRRTDQEAGNPRSKRPPDREDHLHRHLGTRSATFSGRSS